MNVMKDSPTFMDTMYDHLSKQQDISSKQVSKLFEFLNREQYDTDAVKMDISENEFQSNIKFTEIYAAISSFISAISSQAYNIYSLLYVSINNIFDNIYS